ncbi:arylsulfatase [Flammeovirga pectinis]|uniref:Arylsulfatase n=1 Tax=Flammeovirga pectinis TaxID=2494373 RepID=A0A3S9NYY5_9BACT|nr:arylsulfatase [Flammeovirga pectinis]AZQ61151.1 arylsulfatase [Flammeovirga pectinis]
MKDKILRNLFLAFMCLSMVLPMELTAQGKKGKKPNIIVMWGDDIGLYNISYWNRGLMGYKTPGIDRVGDEGLAFTDYYGEQSCTAGRSSFITGQCGLRTGMTKVGLPKAPQGQKADDITIAEVLKNQGYVTGQFGKNHLGDADENLPTKHGFDEFYGILYHLNAMQEPEDPDYPKDAEFLKKFGPRGVLDCTSDGPVKDTGPLTIERMKTIDDEINVRAKKFIDKAVAQDKPFFVWWNSSRMHFITHVKKESRGISGQGFYNDGMMEHDGHVGDMLDYLEEKGLTENTIVIYGTDNGPHFNAWPDGAITHFRSEKETNWEGAYRVPTFIRWPGKLKAGEVKNGLISHLDWLPTLAAAAGEPDIKEKLMKGGYKANGKSFKVHLDGYNMLPYLKGEVTQSPRNHFIYNNADAQIVALRYEQRNYVTGNSTFMAGGGTDGTPKVSDAEMSTAWKIVYAEQRGKTMELWSEPFTWLRMPKIFNLRRDPFERADHNSNNYWTWFINHPFVFYGGNNVILEHIESYKEYPPSQRPGSFTMDGASEMVYKNFGMGPGGSSGPGIKNK